MSAVLAALLTISAGTDAAPAKPEGAARLATFNVWELSREKLDRVDPSTGQGADEQLRNAAAIVQAARPDVLLIGEIDQGENGEAARLLLKRYLNVSQAGGEPIDYPHLFVAPVNTGYPSGMDLNRDGDTTDPDDAWGYGRYPGQYGMAMYSRFPIDRAAVRTFQMLRWRELPRNLMPDGRDGRPA